jgi:pimeloyl-ACP methyl ester carboxylesterase
VIFVSWAARPKLLTRAATACLLCGLAACASLPPSPVATTTSPLGLYVDCRGQAAASPTVILESGAFGTSADWDFVLADLAKGGRVCAYDRGGVGASPPRAGDQSVTAIAHELAGLLDRLGETGPVILVGHSNGALYIETFAALWPNRVAGLVYVNGVTSNDLDDPALLRYLADERRLSDLAVDAADLGLAPLGASAMVKAEGLQGEAAARKVAALTDLRSLRVARDEDRAIVPGLTVTREVGGSPPAIPTVVIVGTTRPDIFSSKAWRAAEIVPAQRARRSWILDALGATHVSPLARDRAWIVAAVDWLRSLNEGEGARGAPGAAAFPQGASR